MPVKYLQINVNNQTRIPSAKKVSLAFAFFLLASSSIYPHDVHAQEISLSTYPSTIQLKAKPPVEAKSTFTVENKSSSPVKLNIILKPFKPDSTIEGKVSYIEGSDPAIFKQVQILDNGTAVNTIEIGPKQSKNLDLRIEVNEQEQPQDYYFSVIFMTTSSEQPAEGGAEASAKSIAQAGIGINVLLAVGPNELPKGFLEEFSTQPFRNSGPVPFSVKVRNNGDHFFTPKGVILIKNVFGQTVGRVDLQNTNILANTSRSMLGKAYTKGANQASANDFSTSEIRNAAVWPQKFLFGVYRADLSIALSEEGPLFTQSLTFLALPTNIILASTIAGILILLIALRVRRKLRNT